MSCISATFTQNYVYDALNRIQSVTESGSASWSRTYTYDRYGNRAVGAAGLQVGSLVTPTVLTAYDASNNRLTGSWANYDNAGNMTSFLGSGGQWSADYDAENKQRFYYCNAGVGAACQDANPDAEYVYDGEGNRVQKLTPGATTTYVYDAFGRLAAEYTVGGPAEETGTFYRTTDHLGSTRLVINAAGGVKSRRDFFPFGEQIDADATSGRIISGSGYNVDMGFPQLFTAKERDDESGLDYFGARYFGSSLGRFTSADAPFADQYEANPQSWNLYAYVRNNPLRLVDPTGRACVDGISSGFGDASLDGQACFTASTDVPLEPFAQGVSDRLGQTATAVQPLMNAMATGLSLLSGFATAGASASLTLDLAVTTEVIIDTSALPLVLNGGKVLGAGEIPVITETIAQEAFAAGNIVERGIVSAQQVNSLNIVPEAFSATTASSISSMLRQFGSRVGVAGDSAIGSTAATTGRSLVTRDSQFAATMTELGFGDLVRFFSH